MRDYSKVGPKFWIGATGKRLRAAGMEAQIVAMYLMTSPHANMLGLYYCPITFIAHETGLPLEGALKGLQRAIEAGFCEYDEASEVVWVIEMAAYQIGESLKPNDLRVKGVQNEYDSLPDNPYLTRFYEKYSAAFCMSKCRGKTKPLQSPFEAPSKPLRSQEQEQEQEQKKEQKTAFVSRSQANAPPAKFSPPVDELSPAGLTSGRAQDPPQDALDTALAAPAEPLLPDKPAAKPDAKPDKRGSRLPNDWQLPKNWGEWALQKRPDLTVEDVRNQAERFADYWHAKTGVNARKADWEATWRNWIRDAKTARQDAYGYARSPPTRRDCYAEQSRRISEMAAQADAVMLAQRHQRPAEIDMGVIHASPAT